MRAAVVYNPIKIDLDAVKAVVDREQKAAGWDDTLWFDTSKEDPGRGATLEALEAGSTWSSRPAVTGRCASSPRRSPIATSPSPCCRRAPATCSHAT